MAHQEHSPWSEEEYTEYLAYERHMFAWCLVIHGNISWPDALLQAEQRYPYESAREPYRGMIFHDEAWHYAMLRLFGDQYWLDRPELGSPSDEYRGESKRYEQSKA